MLSTIIGVVVLLGITAPLWHIWADKTSSEEFIGFANSQRFLYAFGSYFASFCFASFVFWIKNFIDQKHKNLLKVINSITGVFLAINTYFLIWVFNPYSDFPKYVYDIVFTIAAIFIAYGIYFLNNFVVRFSLDKKYNIRNLLAFIARVRTNHYKKVAAKAYYAEVYNKAMVTEETVEDNANEFEEDLYNTLEKVDNYDALEQANR